MENKQKAIDKVLALVLCLALLLAGPPPAALTVYAQEEDGDTAADTDPGLGRSGEEQLLLGITVLIDDFNFPDPIFRDYVGRFDFNGDGVLSQIEIESVYVIAVDNMGISDLTGIKHFTSLAGLSCAANQLTSLDLSGCAGLQWLQCSSNRLTSLDVSGCSAMEELVCSENLLTVLNISGCSSLLNLNCAYNRLTGLDIRGCGALKELHCEDNLLTSLKVSSHSNLQKLFCHGNQLTSLMVKDCAGLELLYCSDNQLTGLDIRGCASLKSLVCTNNYMSGVEEIAGYSGLSTINLQFLPQLDPNLTYYSVRVDGTLYEKHPAGARVLIQSQWFYSDACFKEWQVDSGNAVLDDPRSVCTAFTMPEEDVALSPRFEKTPQGHNAIWLISYGDGVVSAGISSAAPGEEVALTAAPFPGYALSTWWCTAGMYTPESEEVAINEYSFIMPDKAVLVTAVFEPEEDGEGNGEDNGDGDGNGNGDGGGESNGSTGGTGSPATGSAVLGGASGSFGSGPRRDRGTAKTRLPAEVFSWDGQALTVHHNGVAPLGLLSVQWNGVETKAYSLHEGSVLLRFDPDFLAAQPPGDHTVRVEFLNHWGEAVVTVGKTAFGGDDPANNENHNPNTGAGTWPGLLPVSLCAGALVLWRTNKQKWPYSPVKELKTQFRR